MDEKSTAQERLDIPVARVIVFKRSARGWYSPVVVTVAYLFWGIGGVFAGWRLVVAAPVWWWQGVLAIIWAGFLGVLQWPLWILVRRS